MSRRRTFRLPKGGNAGLGVGCLVLMAVGFAGWIILKIVEGLIAVCSTPYPWIVIALGVVGYASYLAPRLYRRQRLQKVFFDTVFDLGRGGPDAERHLADLQRLGESEGDALLLFAAGRAFAGELQEALDAIDRAALLHSTVGHLAGGIALCFPAVPIPIPFGADGSAITAIRIVQAATLTGVGRAQEAINWLATFPHTPENPTVLLVLADAYVAVGNYNQAIPTLERATISCGTNNPLADAIHRKLGICFEAVGAQDRAAEEYSTSRDPEAQTRLSALRAHRAQEQRRLDSEEGERIVDRTLRMVRAAHGPDARRAALAGGLATIPHEAARTRLRAEAEAMEPALRAAELEAERTGLAARDQEAFERALARMEAAKGPAGRRSALQEGLDAIQQPSARQRLLLEASKVEVQAVLDKVDGLKTASAKRRHLTAALDALRADDVPDELQAEQIRWLESALGDLDR